MKRVICLFTALFLCMSLVCPVFAAENFVPSISDKDEPEIVPPTDEEGVIGLILDEEGNVIGYVEEDCLVITPISKANTSTEIPEDARELLLNVYDELSNGNMEIPYEKFGADLDPEDMVIRDLIDATWLCEEHPEMLAPQGVVLQLIFDLGVAADTDVYVMTYKNNEWNPIVSTKNNGDGTVTCTFEDLCLIAFCVDTNSTQPPAQTGDDTNLVLWVTLLAVSSAAMIGMVAFRRKVVN